MEKGINQRLRGFYLKYNTAFRCYRKDKGAFGISYYCFKNRHSYKHLIKYKNIHKEGACFIIGTGPSLTLEDVEKVRGFKTFGVNTIFKLYEKTSWRADYYCIIDPKTYSNIKDELGKQNVENIFIAENRMREDIRCNKNAIPFLLECSSFYRIKWPEYFGATDFGTDLADEIYDGASVVYAALQIAVYMGFKDIYLLGVDCNYDSSVLHNANVNYSKDYDYKWTKQTGLAMIEGFKVAKEYADKHDVNIYNATRGGMLEVFPRVDLDTVV